MNPLRHLICVLTLIGFLVVHTASEAKSLGDMLKALGTSIANANKHPSPHPAQKTTRRRAKDSNKSGEQGNATAETTPDSSATPPPPTPTATPSARPASRVVDGRTGKRDLPYGIPVPNKPGFVTSPFAPDAGLVDVRGFPSGTEVKDPHTGKIFLTP